MSNKELVFIFFQKPMFNLGYKWLTFIFEYLKPKMRVVLLCLCIHQIQYLFISVKIWHKAMISWIVLEEMNLNNNCRWLNQTPCCCFYWTLKPGKTFSSIARLCCLEFLKMLVMAHLTYKNTCLKVCYLSRMKLLSMTTSRHT